MLSKDIKYNIKINKKLIERKETIIIFGNKKRLKLMKDKNIIKYFIYSTFKIITKIFQPNKLLAIATINYKENKTILIGFVCFKYKDSLSYYNIFYYLNEIYNFNPDIIYSYYERAISYVIRKSSFFNNEIINVKYFFSFYKYYL